MGNLFPYVNGGLFSGSLDWTKINPDIFGSMIQAVADDEERGTLGMHYTSVPNILKVLNPLFLDELRDPAKMPANLREAHDRNDETLERIYLGRRFKNDTERLEKLFELYTQMIAKAPAKKAALKRRSAR